jgi:hypothetical protein
MSTRDRVGVVLHHSTERRGRSSSTSGSIRAEKTADNLSTFREALDERERDEVVKGALPGEMYRVFMYYERDEWERRCANRQRLGPAGVPGRASVTGGGV